VGGHYLTVNIFRMQEVVFHAVEYSDRSRGGAAVII
jgi:hypothetical protein